MSDATRHTPESLLDEIALVYDNLIIERGGDTWACYELKTETYDMQALQTKKERHGLLTSIIGRLQPQPGRAKIIVTNQDFDHDRYMDDLLSVNPESKVYRQWLPQVERAVMANAQGARKKVYLSVRLNHAVYPPLKRAALGEYQALMAWGRQRVGAISPIPEAEIVRHKQNAAYLADLLAPMLAEPAVEGLPHPQPVEIARLIRHLYQRGVPHDEVPAVGTLFERFENGRVLIPNTQAWRSLVGDVSIYSYFNHLTFYHGNGTKTFQRFLGLSQMPTSGLGFPGDEYAYPKKVPADVLLDFDLTPHYEAERRREGKEQRLEAQKEHVHTAGGKIDVGLAEASLAHREMEATYRSGMPRVGLHASYCVSADNLEELESRSKTLTDELQKHRVGLFSTHGTQIQGFADYIPAGTRRLSSYQVPMPPETLAGSYPIAVDHAGDDEGPMLGRTHRTASPVFFNPIRAMTENENSALALIGAQGSGKSMTMYTIFAQLCLAGYWQILLDPKGDARNISNIKEISGALHEVFIEPGTEVALPIMKLYPMEQIRKTWRVLTDFLVQMFGAMESQTELDQYKRDVVRMASTKFVERFETANGNLPIAKLKDSFRDVGKEDGIGRAAEVANQLAHQLDTYSKNDLTSVVLSDEGDVFDTTAGNGIASGDPRSIIFYTHELRLQRAEARANNVPATEEERVAQAVLSVVAAAAYELAGKQRFSEKVFRGVHVDESWQITATPTGKALLDFLMRQARSQWVGSFLASQKWADVKGFQEHLGAIFLGKNPSRDDIHNALTYMGVTPDEKTVSSVQSFSGGDFVFKDVDDNVAPIKVEPIPSRWLSLLDTTPGKTRQSQNRAAQTVGAGRG